MGSGLAATGPPTDVETVLMLFSGSGSGAVGDCASATLVIVPLYPCCGVGDREGHVRTVAEAAVRRGTRQRTAR